MEEEAQNGRRKAGGPQKMKLANSETRRPSSDKTLKESRSTNWYPAIGSFHVEPAHRFSVKFQQSSNLTKSTPIGRLDTEEKLRTPNGGEMMPSSTSFGNLSPWSEPAWCHGIPSPYYNDSHRRLRDAIRAYVDERILPYSLDWEAKGEAPREEAMRWAQSGFAFADVPPEYRPKDLPGPAGIPIDKLDVFHLLVSTDETSRVEGGVTSSLSGASVIGIPPVIHHGTEQQKRQWLPGLFDWTTSFCLGITEPTGGSDVANIQTTAVKSQDGKHYVVNGYKKWITGAPWATHMTTAVRTGGAGMSGLSVLVIPMDSPGLTWRRIPNSGQNAGGASLVELDDVKVPVENRLGKEGDGFRIIMVNFNRERYIMAIGSNRKARTCLNIAFEYANKRETFGKPLISNQIIAAKFAT
ncbi:acyl-CoA dehydrogenase, partial [Hortaea werneckii]